MNREAILSANSDAWEFYLARSRLENVQKHRREVMKTKKLLDQYNANVAAFEKRVQTTLEEKKNLEEKIAPLRMKLLSEVNAVADKLKALCDSIKSRSLPV